VSHIVDKADQEQQGAATKQPEQTRVKSNEDNDRERRGNVDSNTAQKRGGLLVPAILSWLRHYAACASERGNKWRYDDRDAEGETKADCEQVYRGQMQHYVDAQLDPRLSKRRGQTNACVTLPHHFRHVALSLLASRRCLRSHFFDVPART